MFNSPWLGPRRALLFWACPSVSVRYVVTLTWSFFIRFLLNFIYRLLPTISQPGLNMGFVGWIINKMADKMAAACQFALVDTLTSLIITRFPPNFLYKLLYFYQTYVWTSVLSDEQKSRWSPKLVSRFHCRALCRAICRSPIVLVGSKVDQTQLLGYTCFA